VILKFKSVNGEAFSKLTSFVHSDENVIKIPDGGGQEMVVVIRKVKPDNSQSWGTWYAITIEIEECMSRGQVGGRERIDPKYLLKVYEIVGDKP